MIWPPASPCLDRKRSWQLSRSLCYGIIAAGRAYSRDRWVSDVGDRGLVGPFELPLVEANPHGGGFPEGVIFLRKPRILGRQTAVVLESLAALALSVVDGKAPGGSTRESSRTSAGACDKGIMSDLSHPA